MAERRRWLWGALLLAGAAGLWMVVRPGERTTNNGAAAVRPSDTASPPALAPAAPPASAARDRPMSASAPASPHAGAVTLAARERAALKQRMQADWCGFGAAEQARQEQAITHRVIEAGGNLSPEVMAEVDATPGGELAAEALAEARARWVRALQQRGDLRSLAAAEMLGGADGDAAGSSARLQALARTSADPMLTALALQRPCEPGRCVNIDAGQWSRLEPANLLAWTALLGEGDAAARSSQGAHVLERIASVARYSRSYERELMQLLTTLPRSPPGLAGDAELRLLQGWSAGWSHRGWRWVRAVCDATVDGGTVQRCAVLADLLWQGETLVERQLSQAVTRRLLPAVPALRGPWVARAREFDAVRQWSAAHAQPWEEGTPHCEAMSRLGESLQRSADQGGEWASLRAEMRAAGADEAALAAQWRREVRGMGGMGGDVPPPR